MAETVTIGSGAHRYRFERAWAKLPRGWSFGNADPAARPPRTALKGAVAANGDVFVVSRSAHPVCVFDPAGNFVTSWGEGLYSDFVHALAIAPDGTVFVTDSGLHAIFHHQPDGTPIRTYGTPGMPSPTLYGNPFNMPTHIAFHPNGDAYVSDGYGNRRVHRFGADGTHKMSWGEPGEGPGQFALVHFIAIDAAGTIYIADRENQRIQLFDEGGTWLADWRGFDMPSDLAIGRQAIYVGGRDGLSIWTHGREEIVRWAADEPYPGAFNIHGIWLDANENIYLAHFDKAVSKLTRLP
jgi:streptogramin lyase